jgi:hypothetical protein
MQFQYRGFKIECTAQAQDNGYIGNATVWFECTRDDERTLFESGSLKSFPTSLRAIDYARVWAEMWCDEQLDLVRIPRCVEKKMTRPSSIRRLRSIRGVR